MTQRPWAERFSHGVARELRRHRERRGLSAQDLADGCAEMGMPIQRSVIANFENGRRASIGVPELVIFAAVLKIPPVWLIAPMGFEESVEIIPGQFGSPYSVAAWFGGEFPRVDEEQEEYDENPVPLYADLVFLVQQIEEIQGEVEKARQEFGEASLALPQLDQQIDELREQMQRDSTTQKDLLEAVNRMSSAERSVASHLFSQADELMARVHDVSDAISRLLSKRSKVVEEKALLDVKVEWLRRHEKNAREVLAEFKKRGWMPPELPEHLEYLLAEPVREMPPKVGRRRQIGK